MIVYPPVLTLLIDVRLSHKIDPSHFVPTTSASCVLGIAAGNASTRRRVCVACSYANASDTSPNSLNAVPRKDSPNGWFGPLDRVGCARASVVLGGRNPRGTVARVL